MRPFLKETKDEPLLMNSGSPGEGQRSGERPRQQEDLKAKERIIRCQKMEDIYYGWL